MLRGAIYIKMQKYSKYNVRLLLTNKTSNYKLKHITEA